MKYAIRTSRMLATALVIALAGAVEASAQTNLSSAWTFTVETDTGITNPAVTLVQDGMTLTGHYSSEALGENDLTGTVDGSEIKIMFTADLQGMPVDVMYTGTINAEGVISGTLDIGGGLVTGTFTAVKTEA